METEKRKEIVFCECGCGQLFLKYDDHNRPRRFVSGHNQRGNFKQRVDIICDYCGVVFKKLECQLGYNHHFCSNHCRAKWCGEKNANDLDLKIRQSEIAIQNGSKPPLLKGELHPRWEGGITVQNKVDRSRQEYVEWKRSVFRRYNYTCQICGIRGGRLSAHHIKEWAKFPELRLDTDNGLCLCYNCHMELHGLNKKTA